MSNLTSIKANLNIPNLLSLFRILILVPFVNFVLKEDYLCAGLVLVLSGITDMFDGYLARKLNQVTDLGKMLDPIADKVTLVTIMICLSIKFPKMLSFMIILVIKEILMLCAGAILLKSNKKPPASQWYGKLSTIIFYISVIIIISLRALWSINSDTLNNFLMILTLVFMIYSLWRYFEIFKYMINSDSNIEKNIENVK